MINKKNNACIKKKWDSPENLLSQNHVVGKILIIFYV